MINLDEIATGELDGQIIWVCDYRHDDYTNKPIRAVKPTKVLVESNGLKINIKNYSESQVVALNKKGLPIKSKTYRLFDNTAHWGYQKNALKCFNTEQECVEFYKTQIEVVVQGLEKIKEQYIISIDSKINELRELGL